MARRRMTLRRIDPWSVLKFGAVINACLFVITLLGAAILWFVIRQLGIIEQACGLATDVGFEDCAVNGANLFRYLFLLGLLWMVVQTGLFVFFAFLHNLIADLVGGIGVTLSEEGAGARTAAPSTVRPARGAFEREGLGSPPPSSDERRPVGGRTASAEGQGATQPRTAAASAGSAASGAASGSGGSGSSGGARPSRGSASTGTTGPRQAGDRPPSRQGGWPWDPQPTSKRGQRSDEGAEEPQEERLFGDRRRDR